MAAVEIIAGIFIVVGIIKILGLLINRRAWFDFGKKFFKNPRGLQVAFLVLSLIVLYFLLLELTLVQVMAVFMFASMFMGVFFAGLGKDLMPTAKKMIDRMANPVTVIYLLIWLLLLVWAAVELFF